MKKGIVTFLFLFLLVLPSVLAISEERYIVELSNEQISDSINNNIVEEIESSVKLNQVARARVGLDKKKIVVKDISKETLELEDSIIRLEPDYKVYSLEEPSKWNYEIMGVDSFISGGEGVKIAVLDTGANYNLLSIDSGYDFVNEDNDFFDDNGHGTLVTQILRNPVTNFPLRDSKIYSIKVLNNNGEGYVSDVIEGINWAIDNNVNILLMSFGGEQDSAFLKEALQEAYNQGILIIAAGGNENNPEIVYPARYNEVIGVGSVNSNLNKSSFSNYGDDLEFVAPGENIIVFDGDNYLEVQGTSFSVPHVGIVAAEYWSEDLGLSNIEVRDKLRESSLDLGEPGRDGLFGWGLVRFINRDESLILEKREVEGYQNLSIQEIFDGKFDYNSQEYTFSVLSFENNLIAKDFLDDYLPEAKINIITGNGQSLWLSDNKLVFLKSDEIEIISKLNEKYPLANNSLLSNFVTLDFGTLASCSCGFSIPFVCNEAECWAKGNSCYLNGFAVCVDGLNLVNGDDSYCRYKEQRFNGCLLNEFDCDSSNECSPNLFCVSSSGSSVCSGFECGCCSSGQIWNSSTNTCFFPQSINSVSWSTLQANTGDTVTLTLSTSGFQNNQLVEFEIWEEDTFLDGGDIIDDPQPSKFAVINNNFASVDWTIPNGGDGIGGNLEFYFKAKINNLESDKSSVLSTKFGHNGWDCDATNQCATNLPFSLICDGNTPVIDTESEGCCKFEENWNNQNKFCNDAVFGKIYSVTQNGQNFNEAPYGNLKLRVFVAEDDFAINPDNIVKSFDLFSDSQGNFAFNPEREVSSWNWDAGFLAKYYIHSIYVIEGNEVIGKWTNQFSDDPKYQNAIESVNQIVRIHKDKVTWRQVPEFPEIDPFTGLSLSTQSLNEQSINIEKPVHFSWNGKLNISETGEYVFLFNITGNVKLRINGKEVINSEKDGIKEGKINLEFLENKVSFEFFESGKHNPKVYWRYEDEEFKEITEENLIRESTKTVLVDELDKLSSLSFSEVNNQPDYMISFLEKPETLRNQKPLILVHGKHGESGYWDEGDAQNWFNDINNGGYDAWEFYYPGDDYINVSGALLGDALDYLKRTRYGSNEKFDIVSHSMGGLVSRSYVQNISPYNYKNDVNHLVMIGSPNYGAGSSVGVSEQWLLTPTQQIIAFLSLCGTISTYSELEDCRINRQGEWESPIYKQMSLGSDLITNLSSDTLSNKSIVIIGDKESVDFDSFSSWLCSQLDNIGGHQEGDDFEHDCLVAISSSSLLNKNIPLSIIPNKNHATEKDEIQDFAPLIKDFLDDKTDSILASRSFSYYNPKTGFKKNFNYQEGSVQIKLLEDGQIWNSNSDQDLQIQKLDSPNQGFIFNLQRNQQSKNYFHFNRNDNQVDSYYTLPKGNYKLVVPGQNDKPELHFEVKPMETNFLTINLIEEICIPNLQNTSWSNWQNISCLASNLINQSRYLVQYDINNCGQIQNTTFYDYRATLNCGNQSNNQTNSSINLIINSPSQDLFNERRTQFNLTVDEMVDKIIYIDNSDSRPREKTLCSRNCLEYGNVRLRTLSLTDGNHSLVFKAIKDNIVLDEKNISFFIDSRDPLIIKTLPTRGFSNGTFNVEFREDNPEELMLYYGTNIIRTKNVSIAQNCILDRTTYKCQVESNLSEFDGQYISYWFNLKDIAGNQDVSRVSTLNVDLTNPVLNNPDSFWTQGTGVYHRYIYFNFNINEQNFDEVDYTDWDARTPRQTRLCSNLRDGICSIRKSFASGNHNLTITILDDAGNSITKDISFVI